jgi:hypothetical protein
LRDCSDSLNSMKVGLEGEILIKNADGCCDSIRRCG